MDGLPTGTVTFLFTDIEGSTRLTQRLGDAFPERLAAHHRILRLAIAENRGSVVSTEGDAFFAVFPVAGDAVRAAVAAQRALAAEAGETQARIRVRMGMHTGAAQLGGDNYTGLDVVRAARIMAAAHGGQVLLSDPTRAVAGDLPGGVHLRQLGSYRLKDLPEPELLHQLEAVGLIADFPPLRALDVRRAHLPPDATTFVGREEELTEVADLIGVRRLITLTGPGGTGKTRLAIRSAAQVADRFDHGAYFVSLMASVDAAAIPGAIATAIGLPEERDRGRAESLADWLREREILLVLDNLEQLEGAAATVDALLGQAPRLRVLATSRGPLHVAGEQEFPVAPFAVPVPDADPATLAASDSVHLFVDRARLVRPSFAPTAADLSLIADICRRLDGLPLAIELAAARTRLLALSAILERLGHRLDALAPGPTTAPRRQQSLRETIAWSHDLLAEGERSVFRRLAAFVGGWTFEDAEVVAADAVATDQEPDGRAAKAPRSRRSMDVGAVDGGAVDVGAALERLADLSLIQVAPEAQEARFTMLATIGEYADEQLRASGEAERITRRHAAVYRRLADQALQASEGPEAATWFDRVERDLDNVRAAIERSEALGDRETALAIAAALGPYWLQRNHSAEGQRILIGLVERAVDVAGPALASAAAAASFNATWLGDYTTGRRLGELAADRYRALGDRRGLALAIGAVGFSMIETDPTAALRKIDEALQTSRTLGDARGEGQAFLGRATALFALGRLAEVRDSLERSIELSRRAGNWFFALNASVFLARIKLIMGEAEDGIAAYRELLQASRRTNLRLGIAITLEYLAEVAVWNGDLARAVRLGAVAARLKEELGGGIPPRIGGGLDPLAAGRASLEPDAFEREVAIGRAMDVDSAVAEAMAIPPPASVPPQTRPSPA
jgi:predicted ATPase/class 3 adenylate cyclase